MGQKKQLANDLATAWWASSTKGGGICDRCSAPLQRGEGYLCKPAIVGMNLGGIMADVSDLPDMICESCFDASPTAEPFEGKYTAEQTAAPTAPASGQPAAARPAAVAIQNEVAPRLKDPSLTPEGRAVLLLETCRIARVLEPGVFPTYWEELKRNAAQLDAAGKAEYEKIVAGLQAQTQKREAPQGAPAGGGDGRPADTRQALLDTEAKLTKRLLPFGKAAAWKALAEAWLRLDYQKTIALLKNLSGPDQQALVARLAATVTLTEADWTALFQAARPASLQVIREKLAEDKPELNLSAPVAQQVVENLAASLYAGPAPVAVDKAKDEQREKGLATCLKLVKLLEQRQPKSALPLVSVLLLKINQTAIFGGERWSGRFLDLVHALNAFASQPALAADVEAILKSQLPQYREFALAHWYARQCHIAADVAPYAQKLEEAAAPTYFGRLWFLMMLVTGGRGLEALEAAKGMPDANLLVTHVRRALLDRSPELAATVLTAADFEGDVIGQFLLCGSAEDKAACLQKLTKDGTESLPEAMWSKEGNLHFQIGIILPFLSGSKSAYTPKIHPEAIKDVMFVKTTTPDKQFHNVAVSIGYEFWRSEKLDAALLQALVAWGERAPAQVKKLLDLTWQRLTDKKMSSFGSNDRDDTLARCQTVFAADPEMFTGTVAKYIRTEMVEKTTSEYRNGQMYSVSFKPIMPFLHLLLAAQKVSGVSPARCDAILTSAIRDFTANGDLMAAAAGLYASDKGLAGLQPPAKLKDSTQLKDWQTGAIRAATRQLFTRLLIAQLGA